MTIPNGDENGRKYRPGTSCGEGYLQSAKDGENEETHCCQRKGEREDSPNHRDGSPWQFGPRSWARTRVCDLFEQVGESGLRIPPSRNRIVRCRRQLFVLADDLAKMGCYPMQLFVLADDQTGDCVDVRDVVGFIIGGVSRNDSQVFRFVDRVGLDDLMVVETSFTQTVVVLGFLPRPRALFQCVASI